MQHRNELHENLVAPSPIVPTCRPSSQLSRRGHRSMSALTTGDPQRPETPASQARSETVPELVQLFQAQNASPSGSAQGSGARDFLKAGHRRLRQLAQRQKKPVDPKVKAEEASRQLMALQQAGFLPPPKPKRSEAKQSLDSTVSSSNLSFMSSSRRDVERIGQPWLDDPLQRLDTRETKDSRMSSIDIRDLTSLVGASVSLSHFEDGNPPPYQPPTQPSSIAGDDYVCVPIPSNAGASGLQSKVQETGFRKDRTDAPPETPNPELATGSGLSATLDDSHQPSTEKAHEPKPAESKDAGNKSARNSTSSNTSASSQTPAHTLKLFPDPMPPRVSSKGAWRISNSRPPNRALPVTPESRELRPDDKASAGKSCGDAQKLSNSTPKTHESGDASSGSSPDSLALPTKLTGLSAASPIHEKFPRPLTNRRPASLPLGAINAFPLPAPTRPLPLLPESLAGINADRERNTAAGQRTPQSKPSTSDSRSSGEVSGASSKESGAQSGTRENKDAAAMMQNGTSKTFSKQSESKELVRTGPSRAERVRALKMKDMSASRLYLKGGDKTPNDDQSSRSSRPSTESSQKTGRESIDSRLSEANSQSPPLSPLLSQISNFPISNNTAGKRACSSPVLSNGRDERSSLSESNRTSRVCRSSSAQSADVIHEDLPIGQRPADCAESPLPSSEDECVSGSSHKGHQMRPLSSNRQKPAPLSLGEHASHRARHSKKKLLHESTGPSTPRSRRIRGVEKSSPQSQYSQSTYYSQESRSSRHRAYAMNLEGRIAHLERQNKILQAALLAALDVGVKENLESLLGGSTTSLSASGTGRTYSSTNSSGLDEPPRRSKTKEQSCYRQESWIASPGSSRRDSYGSSDDSANVRELEDMIEDFDFDWILDKSSSERHPISRN